MSVFRSRLAETQQSRPKPKRWLYIPYDQLSAEMGPLSRAVPADLGLIFIESSWKAARRPYHKQKLALVLSNMRHFALEQGRRGFAVHYAQTAEAYDAAIKGLAHLGAIEAMEPAERELRALLEPLTSEGRLRTVPHEGWLSDPSDFSATQKAEGPWRMDRFYRHMRQKTGLLMNGKKPEGGKFSFDADNRQPWKGEPTLPTPPTFSPDEITTEVCELVTTRFSHHPGEVSPHAIPATREDAHMLWDWAKEACMVHFGPFEDAMTTASSGLFHTRISPLLNLHRLLPRTVVEEVVSLDIPMASKEGFIRQVLGWREFVRHVHRETDGFRTMPGGVRPSQAKTPGDGGYSRWSKITWPSVLGGLGGGAKPNALGAKRAVPPVFWGEASGLSCLDRVVADVWSEAYSHHITRLMILCNLAALLDLEPRQVADWFWVAYADAYDWVVEPNVLGMGLFATGELMTTKPYVSGTPYIHKMSDYCKSCRFHPKKNCPISSLYWAYLARHEDTLADVARLRVPLASLKKRGEDKRVRDQATFEWVSRTLARGRALSPEGVPQ
jgi:deoxyribodipyrimidine photolyase-related protein